MSTPANVNGRLVLPDGTAPPVGSFVQLDLKNIGTAQPTVDGVAIYNQKQFTLSTVDGSWSGSLYRNDNISCNGVFNSVWAMTYFSGGRAVYPAKLIALAQASADLDTLTAVNLGTAPAAPVFPSTGAAAALAPFTVPASTWTCVHNFGTQAVVAQFYDLTWTEITPATAVSTNVNTFTGTFASPQSGYLVVFNVGNWTPSVVNPNNIIGNPVSSQSITGDFPFTVGGSVDAKRLVGIRIATDFAGADIFAKANAAFADGSNQCTVYIPAGTYNAVTTTLNVPVVTNGTACLWIDPGAVINYTGTGHAIEANGGSNQSSVNLIIYGGGRIVGTSSGLSGLHLKAFNKAQVYNLYCYGFTTGDCFLNEGVNSVDFYGCNAILGKYGVRNVGVQVSAVNYAANKIMWHGGQIGACSSWGWFEDGSQSATVGPNEKNVAIGVVFENNGTDGSANTGNVFFQRSDACALSHCYLEYFSGSTKTQSVSLGDATYAAQSSSIKDCIFLSVGVTSSISAVNAQGLTVSDNLESATVTNFLLKGVNSRSVFMGLNRALAATNLIAGDDSAGLDTVTLVSGGNQTWLNATGVTANGYGFNSIAGLNQDLRIRTRSGGTNNLIGQNAGAGTTIYSINDSGKLTNYNAIALVSNGVPSEVATVDLTAQTAAIGTTTLYAVPANGAGQYRISWNAKVTTAAGTSSTLGPMTIAYTDPDGVTITQVVAASQNGGTITNTGVTNNNTVTVLYGVPIMVNCKASTNITYSFAYASVAANAMQYNLHIKLEAQ